MTANGKNRILLAILPLMLLACPKAEDPAAPPVAAFSCEVCSGLAPLQIQFHDESMSEKPILSWGWDFGDGTTASTQFPLHTYTVAGTYTVKLTVSSEAGTDTCVQNGLIEVGDLQADFTADVTSGLAPLTVNFTDLSSASVTITSWAWSFGDGGNSSQANPVHSYASQGTFDVSLTIQTSGGPDTCTKTAYVTAGALDAEFSADVTTGTAPLAVTFTDLSTASGTITSWTWSFGDGAGATTQDPVHSYVTAGTYNVSLTVTTSWGSDTESKNAYVTVSAAVSGKPTNGSGGASGSQTGSYNGRAYRLWVPSTYSDSTPSPIVVCFHGLGDTYTNFYNVACFYGWQSSANSRNYILMVPNHKNATRASFLHFNGTSFDMASTVAEMNDVLNCIYYGVGANYNIETTRIYWTGFSEGGTFSDLSAYVLNRELRAVAPYAGCVGGKQFPLNRKVPVYAVCGTLDGSYSHIASAFQEWVTAGHPTNNSWVSGIGHSYSGLCTSGPTPDSVYQWMSTVSCQPVVSGLP